MTDVTSLEFQRAYLDAYLDEARIRLECYRLQCLAYRERFQAEIDAITAEARHFTEPSRTADSDARETRLHTAPSATCDAESTPRNRP